MTESKPMIVVTPETAIWKISPFGFHRYATEFFAAAHAFTSRARFSPVPYYLYCRSAELLLKAFLLAKGDEVKSVKDTLGHDLVKALHEARQRGLNDIVTITERQEEELRKANAYYVSKGFEIGRASCRERV